MLVFNMLFEYIETIVAQQLFDTDERELHINTLDHIHLLRRLRDVLAECTSV